MRGITAFLVAVGGLCPLGFTPASARAQDPSTLEGNWFIVWEGFPEGGSTPAALSLFKRWDRACRPRGELEGCLWSAERDETSAWTLNGQWGESLGSSYYGPDALTVSPDGSIRIEQPYFVLGHWGGDSEVHPQGPDALIGRWSYGDTEGTERWTRAVPVLHTVAFVTDSAREVPAGQPGLVPATFDAYWWGPGNDMRGNRPSFYVRMLGDNLWGHHVVNFVEEIGLEPTSMSYIRGEDDGRLRPGNIVGLNLEVVIWPGVTPGRKVLWLDDIPIPFDLRIEGFPSSRTEARITDPIGEP